MSFFREYEYKNATVVRVKDADTYNIKIDLGFTANITITGRLNGFDAYETRLIRGTTKVQKQWGLMAKGIMMDLFSKYPDIRLLSNKKGKYGRWLITPSVLVDRRRYLDLEVLKDIEGIIYHPCNTFVEFPLVPQLERMGFSRSDDRNPSLDVCRDYIVYFKRVLEL